MCEAISKSRIYFSIQVIVCYLFCLLLIFPLFTCPCTVRAETDGTGAIQGKILDQNGQPLVNIQVLATKSIQNNFMGPVFPQSYPPWMPDAVMQELNERNFPAYYILSLPVIYQTQSQADGTFLLDHLDAGRYILWAYDPEGRGFVPSIYGFQKDHPEYLSESQGYYGYYYPYDTFKNYIPVRVVSGETAGPLDLEMKISGILSGRITDAEDGSPIDDAMIMTLYWEEDTELNSWEYQSCFYSTSDSNGDFVITGLTDGRYLLSVVEAKGYIITPTPAPFEEYSDSLENIYEVSSGQTTANCNISLQQGGSIWGRVTNQDTGEPIPDIFVSCYQTEANIYYPFHEKTDPNGIYRITGLDGSYVAMIHHTDEYLGAYYPNTQNPNHAQEIQVASGVQVGSIDFQLVSASITENVRGQIVEGGTGLPLSGIDVRLNKLYTSFDESNPYSSDYPSGDESWESPPPPLDIYEPVSTDAEGRFAFTVLESGSYNLYIFDPANTFLTSSYPEIGELTEMGAGGYIETYFELSENQTMEDIQISLKRGACLEGQVLDGTTPLPGVEVQAIGANQGYSSVGVYGYGYGYAYPGSYPGISQISDIDGRFTFCGLAESDFILRAQDFHPRGYMISFFEDPNIENIPCVLSVSSGDTISDLDIQMKPGLSLYGRVVDKDENPLPHIKIEALITQFAFQDSNQMGEDSLWYAYTTGVMPIYAFTLEDGTYALNGLSEGTYRITAKDPNSSYVTSSLTDITVSSTSADYLPDLILANGGILSGQVTNTSGESLSGIYVQAIQSNYYPDYYTSYDPNDSAYSGAGYGSSYESGEFGSYYSYPDFYSVDYYYQGITKADGTFQIKGLPPGDYELMASDPWDKYLYAQYDSNTPSGLISVAEGESIANLDFILSRGGTIEGTILDSATGGPLEGVVVKAELDSSYKEYYSIPSDEQGHYEISKLPSGSYTVCVEAYENYKSQCYDNVMFPDNATLIEIALEEAHEGIDFNLVPGSGLSGTVRDALTGEALSGKAFIVDCVDEEGDTVWKSQTNNAGEYQFRGLPTGTYSVKVTYGYGYYPGCYHYEGDDPDTCTPIVITQPGALEGFDLYLYPKASISGQVVDESDQNPLNYKWILAIPSSYNLDPNLPYTGYGYGFSTYVPSAVTDPNGRYRIENLEEGDYRVLARDTWYVYAAEYYDNVPTDQWDQADIIHLDQSESRTGINFELLIGETYSGGAVYPTNYQVYQPYAGFAAPGTSYYGAAGLYSGGSYAYGGGSSAGQGGIQPQEPSPGTPSPKIISKPEEQILAGRSFFYEIQAEDAGLAPDLTYSLKLKPQGMTINPESGIVQWQPSNEDAGESVVQIAVYDQSGQMALQSFRLKVEEDLTPPGEVQNLSAREGNRKVTLSWTPSEDMDGDLAEQVLYIDDGEGYDESMILDKAASKYTVRDLRNGRQYLFKLTAKDILGNESNGVSVTATPERVQTTSEGQMWSQNLWLYPTVWPTIPTPVLSGDNQILPFLTSPTSHIWMPMNLSNTSDTNWWLWNKSLFRPSWSLYPLHIWINSIDTVSYQNLGLQEISSQILNPYFGF